MKIIHTHHMLSLWGALFCLYTGRIAKPRTTHDPDSLETALPTANVTVAIAFVFLQTHTGCTEGESEVGEENVFDMAKRVDILLVLHFTDVISADAINQLRLQ